MQCPPRLWPTKVFHLDNLSYQEWKLTPAWPAKKKRYDALNLVLDPSFENILHAPLSGGLYQCNYAQVKASVIVQLSLTVVVIPAWSLIVVR